MIAGQLNLYSSNGRFFTQTLHLAIHNFETIEQVLLSTPEGFDASDNELESRFYFTPLEVNGKTEYVTGSFLDDFKGAAPYRVTVWLLVEDSVMPRDTNRSDHD